MTRKILRIVLALVGGAAGCGMVALVEAILQSFGVLSFSILFETWGLVLLYVASGLCFAIIFFIISPKVIDGISRLMRSTEETLSRMPIIDVLSAVIGLILGLVVALLLCTLVNQIPVGWLAGLISVILYVFCGYFGAYLAIRRRGELADLSLLRKSGHEKSKTDHTRAKPKVLDTSVIIDGRIFDICKTGMIEGAIIVPGFVLQELRHIADSADALKRGRGRRGLDILNLMQQQLEQPVTVEERDFEDIAEVDLKLLRLATELGGVVVTNDYNLNKVAGVQKVPVFNINELANAIKPVVLPGEEMHVGIVKEGKEQGQGIGYLDDGTMIVVDGGKRFIGEEVDALVTSVLQTAAGRMIFAKLN